MTWFYHATAISISVMKIFLQLNQHRSVRRILGRNILGLQLCYTLKALLLATHIAVKEFKNLD